MVRFMYYAHHWTLGILEKIMNHSWKNYESFKTAIISYKTKGLQLNKINILKYGKTCLFKL